MKSVPVCLAASFWALAVAPGLASAQTLNETWTVSIGSQVVPVAANGSFLIPNVQAPDQFGLGGPGTSPDFIGDDFVRVVGCGFSDGQMMWAFSEPFIIRQGMTSHVGPLTFTPTPPPLPVSLDISLPASSVVVGGSLQASVIGQIGDGSQVDLSGAADWTTYRTSNADIASVTADGLVEAKSAGIAFVTASNDSATTVKALAVTSETDPLTTLSGFTVLEGDLTFAADATISIVGQPFETMSAADGRFEFTGVPTEGVDSYTVRAVKNVGGQLFIGSKTVPVSPGELSDAGILELKFVDATEVVFVLDTSGSITSRPICDLVADVLNNLQQVAPNTIVTAYGITSNFPGGCSSSSVLAELGAMVPGNPGGCGANLFGNESWGPATAIVADRFPWTTTARVIIPVSDEGPCNGGSGCNSAADESIANAITIAQDNGCVVLPVLGFGSGTCVRDLAGQIAFGTGGSVTDVGLLPNGYFDAGSVLTDFILGVAGQ